MLLIWIYVTRILIFTSAFSQVSEKLTGSWIRSGRRFRSRQLVAQGLLVLVSLALSFTSRLLPTRAMIARAVSRFASVPVFRSLSLFRNSYSVLPLYILVRWRIVRSSWYLPVFLVIRFRFRNVTVLRSRRGHTSGDRSRRSATSLAICAKCTSVVLSAKLFPTIHWLCILERISVTQ